MEGRTCTHKLRLHLILELFNLLRRWRPALTPTPCQSCVNSATNCRRAAVFHLTLTRCLGSQISLGKDSYLPVNPVQITSLCHCSSATSAGGKHKCGGGLCATKGYAMSNLMMTKDSMSDSCSG